MRHSWSQAIVLVVSTYLLLGCQQVRSHDVTMRAGRGEQTFAEAYAPNIRLPMPRDRFETMLKNKKLKYRILVGEDPVSSFPLPTLDSGIDRKDLAGCIEIYGKTDEVDHHMEVFNAFINKKGEVFFVENSFAYEGP